MRPQDVTNRLETEMCQLGGLGWAGFSFIFSHYKTDWAPHTYRTGAQLGDNRGGWLRPPPGNSDMYHRHFSMTRQQGAGGVLLSNSIRLVIISQERKPDQGRGRVLTDDQETLEILQERRCLIVKWNYTGTHDFEFYFSRNYQQCTKIHTTNVDGHLHCAAVLSLWVE